MNLEFIQTKENPSPKPDKETESEIRNIEATAKRIENDGKRQDIEERKKYANKIFWLISIWLICIYVIICLAGFGKSYGFFIVNDSVLVSLITSTTATVIGLFVIVVNYLFKKN